MVPVDKIPGIAFISKSHRAYEFVLDFVVVGLTRSDGRFRYAAALFTECISSNSTGLV